MDLWIILLWEWLSTSFILVLHMIHRGHLFFSPAPLAFESIERLQHHQWLVASIPRLKTGVVMGSVGWMDKGAAILHPQRGYYSDMWPRSSTSSSYLKQKHVQLGERNTPLKDRLLWCEVGVRYPGEVIVAKSTKMTNQLLETHQLKRDSAAPDNVSGLAPTVPWSSPQADAKRRWEIFSWDLPWGYQY